MSVFSSNYFAKDDGNAPTCLVYVASSVTDPVSASFTAYFRFSKDVNDFVIGDVTYVNTNISAFTKIKKNLYSISVDPISPTTALISISVAAGVCYDNFNRGNIVSNTFQITYNNTVAPFNITPPSISASGDTLTADKGTWGGAGNVYVYQWYADGATTGTNSSTFDKSSNRGASYTVKITATNGVGSANLTTAYSFNLFFDKKNYQGLPSTNLSLTGTSVNSWTDLSVLADNAIQGTASAKPTYLSGFVTFDGVNDFLSWANEITLSGEFSIYMVLRVLSNTKNIFGSLLTNSRFATFNSYLSTTNGFSILNEASTSLSCEWGALLNMNVICISRDAATGDFIYSSNNDRVVLPRGTSTMTGNISIGALGKAKTANFGNIVAGAFCVASAKATTYHHNLIKQYLYSLYSVPIQGEPYIIGLGDSITYFHTWLGILANQMGIPSVNAGLVGDELSNLTSSNNMMDRCAEDCLTVLKNYKVNIVGGTNDLAHANRTPANVGLAMDFILDTLINGGINPRNILVSSTPYQKGDVQNTNLALYRTAIFASANNHGTRTADVFQAFLDRADRDSLMTDQYHPNAAGGVVFKDTFYPAWQGA